nr:MAG TPA: hypothetical protein [Caudoviricetes sp.]
MHKFHWSPSYFVNLDENEKAFVIAAIDIRVEKEREEQKKAEAKMKKR